MTFREIAEEDVAWTALELATALNQNLKSVEAACREQRIPAMKVVGRWRIPAAVCRELVTATKPDYTGLSKAAARDLVKELEARQDTDVAVIVFDERGRPSVEGRLFKECRSGDFYKRQISHYLQQAHEEREIRPQSPLPFDPPQMFQMGHRII